MAAGKKQQKSTATLFRLVSASPNDAIRFYDARPQEGDAMPPAADVANTCPSCGTHGVVDLSQEAPVGMCISCGAVISLITAPQRLYTSPMRLANLTIQALARAIITERQESGRLRDENEFLRARRVEACESEVPDGNTSGAGV